MEQEHRYRVQVLSPKLVRRQGWFTGIWTHAHWCPGCNGLHDYAVEAPFLNGARWSFDGNAETPSFSPSMNIAWGPVRGEMRRCHYFVTGGRIDFCADSTHRLSGQSVPLPDIPADKIAEWERRGFMTEEGGV